MESEFQYIIVPNEKFKRTLDADDGHYSFLYETFEFQRVHEDGGKWNKSDYIIQLKILYLVQLRIDHGHTEEYHELFGNRSISTESFDDFFQIYQLNGKVRFNEIVDDLDKKVFKEIKKTGNRVVDDWIDEIGKTLEVEV